MRKIRYTALNCIRLLGSLIFVLILFEILLSDLFLNMEDDTTRELIAYNRNINSNSFVSHYWYLKRRVNYEPLKYDNKFPPFGLKHLNNLWRPSEISKTLESNVNMTDKLTGDRILPQLIWQMDSAHYFDKRPEPKRILLYDSFESWGKSHWREEAGETGSKILRPSDCQETPHSFTNCIFTQNIEDLTNISALVTIGNPWLYSSLKIPLEANSSVLRFHFILESPVHSMGYFNSTWDLLASYWRGSDLVTPYAKWLYYTPQVKQRKHYKKYHLGKKHPVAVFVSNCFPYNDRDDYIRELQNYIRVDIYGRCGNLTCLREKENSCFQMLKDDYYFYLSFENSNCRDYITEKLFTNAYKNELVPVVMGAHPDDYSALVPQNSYIHVEEFASPKYLAAYLKYLIRHPSKYNKYFEWKDTGEFIEANSLCRICAMTHYADFVRPSRRKGPLVWKGIESENSGMCLQRKRRYWTIPENHNHSVKPAVKPTTNSTILGRITDF